MTSSRPTPSSPAPSFMAKLKAHLITLPRPFAVPIVVLTVALGVLAVGGRLFSGPGLSAWLWGSAVGCAIMAFGHSGNTYWDYYWTRLDDGPAESRSRRKPYTTGQNLLGPDGVLSGEEVAMNLVVWDLVAWVVLALALHTRVASPVHTLIIATVLFGLACGPVYSWAKLHWLPETILFLGFGLCPTLLGAEIYAGYAGLPMTWLLAGRALAVGVPFGLLFGFACEIVDQGYDYTAWAWEARHLRSIGPWCARRHIAFYRPVVVAILLAVMAHEALVGMGLWPASTSWALLALIPVFGVWDGWGPEKTRDSAIMVGLLSLCLYCILVVVLQSLAA